MVAAGDGGRAHGRRARPEARPPMGRGCHPPFPLPPFTTFPLRGTRLWRPASGNTSKDGAAQEKKRASGWRGSTAHRKPSLGRRAATRAAGASRPVAADGKCHSPVRRPSVPLPPTPAAPASLSTCAESMAPRRSGWQALSLAGGGKASTSIPRARGGRGRATAGLAPWPLSGGAAVRAWPASRPPSPASDAPPA